LNLFDTAAFHLAKTAVTWLDADLISSARQNSPAAWDHLLKRHQLPLYTYVAELIHDNAAALDIVQETFVAAVRHIGGLRDASKFAPWLFGIAHQKCVQHWRRARRTDVIFAPTTADDVAGDWPDGDEPDPCHRLMQREEAEAFFGLLGQLPPVQRSALLLHVLEDFSLEEIATVTDVPVGTVKSRLHHAKRTMRQLLTAAQPRLSR
jgi:RNA polymerase sigma-70 factor (ECF subfamily)